VAAVLAYLYRQRVETEIRERRAKEAAARARSAMENQVRMASPAAAAARDDQRQGGNL
jgi:hypothetical protein